MLFILYGCKSFRKYFDNTFRRLAYIIEPKENPRPNSRGDNSSRGNKPEVKNKGESF